MTWRTPKEVAEHFKLAVDDDEPETVRKAIRRRIAEIHPDSNGGKTDDQLWQQLTSAKEFLENYREDSKALIPVSQLPALIQALSLAANNSSRQSPVDRVRESTRRDIRRGVFVPRISSGTVAAVCGFLFAFPKTVQENKLLDYWLARFVPPFALVLLLLYSAALFILTWIAERLEEAHVEWLMTEAGMEETLRCLYRDRRNSNNAEFTFSLRDMARIDSRVSRRGNIIGRVLSIYVRLLTFGVIHFGYLRYTVADKVARGQLDALLEQGVIRQARKSGFGRTYELVGTPFEE